MAIISRPYLTISPPQAPSWQQSQATQTQHQEASGPNTLSVTTLALALVNPIQLPRADPSIQRWVDIHSGCMNYTLLHPRAMSKGWAVKITGHE